MYLKRLEILGFKSFADKVILNFEKGITAIVGPNGSGKSNISDAVKLALGEQSIKNLRGNKLEDVIFAGSESRKPLGFAEVNLVLDNYDHTIPLDYSEIIVTRKLYRSGESEFYINKTPCRLKDINEIFMDTGIGKDGYSVISQGKIDEILTTRAEDRRAIFEEAAGVSKYKYKKEEALKKLTATEENISRLSDIIQELEKQLLPLLEQKETAEQYLKLTDEKKKIDVTIYSDIINKSLELLSKYENDYNKTKEGIQKEATDIENKKGNIESDEGIINKLKEFIDKTKENYFKEYNEIESINGKLELINEKIKNCNENISGLSLSVNENQRKLKLILDNIQSLKHTIDNLKEQKIKLKETLSNDIKNYEVLKKNEDDNLALVENAKEDIVDVLNDIANNKSNLSTCISMKDNILKNIKKIIDSRKRLISEMDNKNERLEELSKNEQKLNNDISSLKNKKNKKVCELDLTLDKMAKLDNEIINIKQMLNSTKLKLSTLKNMEENYDGYSNGVKNLMKYINNNGELKKHVIGVIGELIHVDSKYSLAIEVALGGAIQDIVIKSLDSVKGLIHILKINNFGRATFLPLDNINHKTIDIDEMRNDDGIIGIASDIIRYDKMIENAIKFTLGRIIIVKDLDNAIKLTRRVGNKYKIVTLKGDVINSGGSVSGGSIYNRKQNILSRKENIIELNKKYNKLMNTLDNYILLKNDATNKSNLIKKEINDLDNTMNVINNKLNDINKEKTIIDFEVKKLKGMINDSEFEEKQMNENIISYDKDIEKYNQKIKLLEAKKIEIDNTIKVYKDTQGDRGRVLSELENKITNYKIEIAKTEQNLESQNKLLFEEQANADLLRKDIKKYEQKIESLKNIIITNQKNKKDILEKRKNLESNIEDYKLKIDEKENKIIFINKNLDNKKEDLVESQKSYSRDVEKLHKIEINIQRVQLDIENVKNRLWNEYELTLSNSKNFIINGDPNLLKNRSLKLTKEIRGLGSVNLNSIYEYKKIKERYDFLKNQYDDLNKAKESLYNIINETNKIIKSRFKDNFELIRIQFSEIFKRLFGGGYAELKLTNPSDLFNTGIEINVQPPGKKLQSLSLLSGGEKALVAISLLFAMLLIRPTPFCILDEIDAALDDANVDRFATFLKELSENSQFIVVTHRKGTMAIADIMYGVTMQDKGISTILSLKLESA